MSSQDTELSHGLPVAVSYLWGGHKRVSLWVGIIATCEIPVVRCNYCVFLSLLYVLPVKRRKHIPQIQKEYLLLDVLLLKSRLDFSISH